MSLNHQQWEIINSIAVDIHSFKDHREMRRHFLERINELIPHTISFFDLGAKKNTKVTFFDPVSINMSDEWLEAYYKDYEAIDIMYWFFSQEENDLYRDSDFITSAMRDTSAFYKGWMEPQGTAYSMGSKVALKGILFGSVNIWRGSEDGDFTDQEMYILKQLNRHLSLYFYNKFPHGIKQNNENDYTADTLMHMYHLTKREAEIVNLLYEGMSIKDISSSLYITENTVKKHTHNLFAKMNVSTRSQLLKLVYDYLKENDEKEAW